MSSELEKSLRRLKPDKHVRSLKPRERTDLSFLGSVSAAPKALLYDTTVYIDVLQGRFPIGGEAMLVAADAWHSSVSEGELAALFGLLDPGDARTKPTLQELKLMLEKRPIHRTISPDNDIWREAGILAGVLARLQGVSKQDRGRLQNDALIFATARKRGLTVLTRNVSDFHLLQQLDPSTTVLFYDV